LESDMTIEEIYAGVKQFQNKVFIKKRSLFKELEHEQHPTALFITCSDSRVDPTLITQCEPGNLFVLRNAGNIIPPHDTALGVGQEATVNYALKHLGIQHIVVCGHTDCGAMHMLLEAKEEETDPLLWKWLACSKSAREEAQRLHLLENLTTSEALRIAAQLNVKRKLKTSKHCRKFKRESLKTGCACTAGCTV
jgi:carbonic anhydrase